MGAWGKQIYHDSQVMGICLQLPVFPDFCAHFPPLPKSVVNLAGYILTKPMQTYVS